MLKINKTYNVNFWFSCFKGNPKNATIIEIFWTLIGGKQKSPPKEVGFKYFVKFIYEKLFTQSSRLV